MKKRLFKLIGIAALALTTLAALSACGEEVTTTNAATEPPHVHEYRENRVEPTVDTRGYIEQVCECGDVMSTEYFGIAERDENPLVLFVGNSYTHYNNLHQIFKHVVNGQGIEISTYAVTKGGHTLLEFADPNDVDGKKLAAYLASKDPNYIFLQEQSERPAKDPALFYDGVRKISEKLSGEDAEIILYQTWGRKEPHTTLTSNGWTHETMAYKLAASYEAIAEEMGYALSPAGSAFLDVYVNHPEINLFDADRTHQSPTGSYLIALCHYATLYGFSPIGVEYIMNLPTETVAVLQQAAHDAVFGESIVPEEYRTSSVGVGS